MAPAQQPPPLKMIKMGLDRLEDFCDENCADGGWGGAAEDEGEVYDIFAN